jgi:hypothetical protein
MKSVYELAVMNVRKFDPGAKDTRIVSGHERFRKALKEAVWNEIRLMPETYDGENREWLEEKWVDQWKPNFIPDLWRIDEKQSTIYLYEVEDTNPISNAKLAKLNEYWWAVDNDYWSIKLVVFDRYGLNPREINLEDFSFRAIEVNVRDNKGANKAR